MFIGEYSRPFSFLYDGFHHWMYLVAVAADVQPIGISQMCGQFPLRTQSHSDQERFAGNVDAFFCDAAGKLGITTDLRKCITADQPDMQAFQILLIL